MSDVFPKPMSQQVKTSLRDKVKQAFARATAAPRDFDLMEPVTISFKEEQSSLFRAAVQKHTNNTAIIDAACLQSVTRDGLIEGTDLRLSRAAFGDLCHFCEIPVGFIKKLVGVEEELALEVIRTMLSSTFHPKGNKSLVIDASDRRVDGIVGTDTYAPLSNHEALEYAITANPDLKISNGWINGPNMRMTALSEKFTAEPVKGDVVRIGMSLDNSINGDRSCRVFDYCERLVCTNGMTARDKQHAAFIRHVGDVHAEVTKAVLRAADRAEFFVPLMHAAASHAMDDQEVKSFLAYVADPAHKGAPALPKQVAQNAMEDAKLEGRKEFEVSLFNMVNGVTKAAHMSESLTRRVELEGLGYETLVKYGVALVN